MADATDLKSVAAKACGFESRPGHFARSKITNSMEKTNGKRKKTKKSSKKQLFLLERTINGKKVSLICSDASHQNFLNKNLKGTKL